jgi:hypothetical protein
MRAYTFALYNMMANILLFTLTAFPLFGVALSGTVIWSGANGTGTYEYVDNATYNFTTSNGSVMVLPHDPALINSSNVSNFSPTGVGDIDLFNGVILIATQFWKLTAFTGWLLYALGFHLYVYMALTAGQYFVYVFGIIQFVFNRPEKPIG